MNTLTIRDAGRGETLLDAALRAGMDIPNSCRAGGCATCKCRLVDGAVTQRTETAYLLSEDELKRGFILACQSVPRGPVTVEVTPRGVDGRIVQQDKLASDMTRVVVQLDAPVRYRAGQFANLTLDGVTRSYSFTTPSSDDGRVELFVRKMGQLSTRLTDEDLRGRAVRVDGPHGDFWLRASDAPLYCVAGGSGLAPILAMLREARGSRRPVTLVLGVRHEVYATAEIEALAREWNAPFRFVPVVGDVLPVIDADTHAHAYVCGPPAMVEAVREKLTALGVPARHVHFDRFITRADADKPAARVWHYAKFLSFHALAAAAAVSMLFGFSLAGLLAIITAYLLGDALLGDDTSTPRYTQPAFLTAQLWLALPLLALVVFAAVWTVSHGSGSWVPPWILTGLMIGLVGTIPAHELTHRTWDPVSMRVGRWLLAFSFDTVFSIEHVYGHHRYVATHDDPATAPRGRNVYWHIVASTLKGNLSAWRIERERLGKRGRRTLSLHNAVLRGHAMSLALVACAYAIGGMRGAAFFVACALLGKALLEVVNYMEHYGLVRVPGTAVQPRHSWNTNRRVSSWAMFNLTRHSHHHAQGEVPYHRLEPYPDAPMMLNGYLATLVIALMPPLWHRLMAPKLAEWDKDYASDEERQLCVARARHNQ